MGLSVFLFTLSFILTNIVFTPNNIERWVNDSGAYETAASDVRLQVRNQLADQLGQNQIIDTILQKTITAKTIRQLTEPEIHSTLDWLSGQTLAQPNIKLDPSIILNNTSEQIINDVRSRLNALPVCTYANLPVTNDVFSIKCTPPGGTERLLEMLRSRLTVSLAPSNSMQINIPTDQLKPYQKYYQWLLAMPLITLITFITSTILYLLMVKPRRKIILAFVTIFIPLGILGTIISWVMPKINAILAEKLISQISNSPYKQNIEQIISDVTRATAKGLLTFGLAFLVLGVVFAVIYWLTKNKQTPARN